jgi:hypothetical protein
MLHGISAKGASMDLVGFGKEAITPPSLLPFLDRISVFCIQLRGETAFSPCLGDRGDGAENKLRRFNSERARINLSNSAMVSCCAVSLGTPVEVATFWNTKLVSGGGSSWFG